MPVHDIFRGGGRYFISRYAALGLCVFLPATARAAEPEKAARLATLSGYVDNDLAAFDKFNHRAKPEPKTRDLTAAALATVMAKDLPKAQSLLTQAFALQEMRADAPNYGNVPWQQNHPELVDPNAIEFMCLSLAPLFVKYGDQLPAAFREEARPHLQGALAAVRRHPVPVWYTNIFLMKLTNTILLGEYLGDAPSVAEGKAALQEWMRFTGRNGITEYASPVYAGVQLTDLHVLYACVVDQEIKTLAGLSLDYLWTDAAANYFPPSQTLSGSNSRTYSFLFHDRNVNLFYYLYGFQSGLPGRGSELAAEALAWAVGTWDGYTPSTELLALSRMPTRLIKQRVGEESGKDRYNFISPGFSLGSSSFFYEHQDREICLLLDSPKNLPAITMVLDPFDAPFGKVQVQQGKSGRAKLTHLRNSMAAVQDGGVVLSLMDMAPEANKKIGDSVATNILFPLKADELLIDGQPLKWEGDMIEISNASVLCLREGHSAVAMRIFHADGGMDGHPVFCLRNDGREYGVGRLVAYHTRGYDGYRYPPFLRGGVLILAAECEDDAAFAKFVASARDWKVDEQMENGIWKAVASGPSVTKPDASTSLSASLDIAKRAVVDRSVDGKAFVPDIFSVNGRDLAAEWRARTSPVLPSREKAEPER